MFGTINSLIRRERAREAEATDARLDLKKQNETFALSRDGRGVPQHKTSVYDYDVDQISLRSALLFLEGFLEDRLERSTNTDDHEAEAKTAQPWLTRKVSNENLQKANKVYGRASRLSGGLFARRPKDHSPEDLKTIYHLIQDLRALGHHGVETLKIESGLGFLDAIRRAVTHLKSNLPA